MLIINAKNRFRIFFDSIILLTMLLSGCGNGKMRGTTTGMAENPLSEIFKTAYAQKLSQYELARMPEIKEAIIEKYSDKFYNLVLENTQVCSPVEYDSIENIYTCQGGLAHFVSSTGSMMRYCVGDGQLLVDLQVDDIPVEKNGEFNYGNWEKAYYKDDFEEDIRKEPYVETTIEGSRNSGHVEADLHIRANKHEGLSFWIIDQYITFEAYDIEMKIKNNTDNEVFPIPIERIDGRFFVYTNPNIANLINLLDRGNITISIRNKTRLEDEYLYVFKQFSPTYLRGALKLLDN